MIRNLLHAWPTCLSTVLVFACTYTGIPHEPTREAPPLATPGPSVFPLVFGRPGCDPPSPRIPHPNLAFGAVVGTTTAGESMRAIMEPLIHAGDEAKLILKMTGSGELTIYAAHLDGTRLEPTLIDKHVMGSSFAAPGQEWGVFFRFTKPGCWQLHAKRDSTEGDIWFIAGPARGSGVAGDLL